MAPQTTKKHSLLIELDSAMYDRLLSIICPDGNSDAKEEAANRFAGIAVEELLGWILGEKRYRSVTELQISWIEQIYLSLFPDKMPKATVLYNSFNIPYGQATYIARVLAEKDLPAWRGRARNELKSRLEDQKEEAKSNVDAGGQDRFVKRQITVTKLASLELFRIATEIWEDDKSFKLPERRPGIGDVVNVDIPSVSILTLLDHPEIKG